MVGPENIQEYMEEVFLDTASEDKTTLDKNYLPSLTR